MWKEIVNFIGTNWLDILLVLVGLSAFFVFFVQERRKVSEAASLIIMQVEDLQKRIREIDSYISEGVLNDTAFYESQMLFKINYWNQYNTILFVNLILLVSIYLMNFIIVLQKFLNSKS